MTSKPCPNHCGRTCDASAKLCRVCYKVQGHPTRGDTNRKCRNFATCGSVCGKGNTTGFCHKCIVHERAASQPGALVQHDKQLASLRSDMALLNNKYKQSLKDNAFLEGQLGLADAVSRGVDSFTIEEKFGSNTSEGTAVVSLSDWHSEELVKKSSVNGMNEFTPEICKARVIKLFQGNLRLVKLLQQDIKIDTQIVGLLGDFITNQLHDESAENNAMMPTEAIRFAESLIISGLDFTLNNSKLNLVLPCHSGNHARTTKKIHVASEHGHSLEWLMYHALAKHYKGEPRVKFIIPDGYHSYIEVYDRTLRMHHGHDIKYQGGIGGLFIPAFRAIQDWNKTKWADIDVFGHHHQMKDGGNFVSNGSLIGFSPFAIRVHAPFEDPKQSLVLIDKKRGQTCKWPILVQ